MALKLTKAQQAALDQYERISSCSPFGIDQFDRGEITARELWEKNVEWLQGVANEVRRIHFPD